MRLFGSKWIVEKRFSSFLADVPAGNPPKTFWARVCPIYTHVSERIAPNADAHLQRLHAAAASVILQPLVISE